MNEYKLSQIEPGMQATFSRVITREMEDSFRTV